MPPNYEPDESTGRISMDLLFAAPICFDFITFQVSFSTDTEGNLFSRQEQKRSLPLMWNRNGGTPQLVVILVKPGSEMDKAGCKVGDELVQVDNLQGQTLTRRAIQDLVASRKKHIWIVHRNGNGKPHLLPVRTHVV
jgi:C-terminal processing protease CtpA/Prc